MSRWFYKRWVWAAVAGTAVAAGAGALAQSPGRNGTSNPGAKDGPRPNDTITLKFEGQPDKKVTVIKSIRKPDGTVKRK